MGTLLACGCATTPPPVDQLGAASRALAAARAADAPTLAPDDYRNADQGLRAAQGAEDRQDFDVATELAAESQVSSELATARARLAKARANASRLTQDNATLKGELGDQAPAEEQP